MVVELSTAGLRNQLGDLPSDSLLGKLAARDILTLSIPMPIILAY